MTEASVEEQLEELQRQSERRREELLDIAARLPAAVSRRVLFRAMAADLRSASGKADVFRRALLNAAGPPREAYTRIRSWFRQSA